MFDVKQTVSLRIGTGEALEVVTGTPNPGIALARHRKLTVCFTWIFPVAQGASWVNMRPRVSPTSIAAVNADHAFRFIGTPSTRIIVAVYN